MSQPKQGFPPEEKRKFDRFDPTIEITGTFELKKELIGQFQNYEKFIVKNISLGGFNLLSNYSPSIKKNYKIFIDYMETKHEFEVAIVHCRVIKLLNEPQGIFSPGVVFSIGCETIYSSDAQKKTVLDIITRSCDKK